MSGLSGVSGNFQAFCTMPTVTIIIVPIKGQACCEWRMVRQENAIALNVAIYTPHTNSPEDGVPFFSGLLSGMMLVEMR